MRNRNPIGAVSGEQQLLADIQRCQQRIVQLDVDIKTAIDELRNVRQVESQREITLIVKGIKDKVALMQSKIDDLKLLGEQVRKPVERDELFNQVDTHRREMDMNAQQLRNATVVAMQTLEEETRNSLFTLNDPEASAAHRRNVRAGNMRDDSQKSTQKLSELVTKMNEQVEVSGKTLSTLVDSSSMLKSTETEFHTMGSTIQVSNKLLSKYSRREFTDRILFALTVLFFFGTVLYIVRKRLVPGGFW